ncbi:hypothetical protein NUW58_g200 [Xylaria curta]|uniref:Uncharacterized protein n=1 Tax=Xylaria curta TaxID=42375 RepID=A0ACC1PRT3_9PEZI|nr:hypothetical protein NUW58_g200 [Xylaria curta]
MAFSPHPNTNATPETLHDDKLVIGLEYENSLPWRTHYPKRFFGFGTTYSGAVWVSSTTPNELYHVRDWPANRAGDQISDSDKVPSRIRYLGNGEFEWGHQIAETETQGVHNLFKLALEPRLFQQAGEIIGGILPPQNVDKTITDYMTGIFECVLRDITGKKGQWVVDKHQIHVVLTVPAIWSDLAKQRTLQAFRNIPNLAEKVTTSLLSEPEAAAISALSELKKHSLKEKDTFVVVDAGGGTVDLITYTVESLFPMLKVHEATEGTGDLCGSSLINLRFQEFLTARLQDQRHWRQSVLNQALANFERRVKRGFSVASLSGNETYNIHVRGLQRDDEAGIFRNNIFTLRAADVHMFYERYILRITQLVKEQITMCQKPIRSIALVGGFGQSTYLRERIETAIREDKSILNPIEILQPPNAWTAVARGAAMKGVAEAKPENYDIPVVMWRTARKHYGYEVGIPFDDHVHASLANKKYWDGLFGIWRVKAMVWFIERGNRVSENVPFQRAYFNHWPVGHQRSRTFPMEIYADETSPTAPIERSVNVRMLSRLTANLSSIPDGELEQKLGKDGRMHYYVKFSIEATYHSASTQYTLIYKGLHFHSSHSADNSNERIGKRYDTVIAEYV